MTSPSRISSTVFTTDIPSGFDDGMRAAETPEEIVRAQSLLNERRTTFGLPQSREIALVSSLSDGGPRPLARASASEHITFQATLQRIAAQLQSTADLKERTASAASARRIVLTQSIMTRAEERGVPLHPDVQAVLLLDRPYRTPALQAVHSAIEWRRRTHQPPLRPRPVTLVLAGVPGSGKTSTLAWIVSRWTGSALYTQAIEVAILPETSRDEDRRARARFASVDLLAIDEAGLEESERAGQRLAALLCARHDAAKFTIIATNLASGDFAERYLSPRVKSRVSVEQSQRGCPWWRDLEPVDYRKLGALSGEHSPMGCLTERKVGV